MQYNLFSYIIRSNKCNGIKLFNTERMTVLLFCGFFNVHVFVAFIAEKKKILIIIIEPRREKTGLRGFRPGPTQTDLYKLRKELDA